MKPGSELDRLIAEHVLSAKWEQQPSMATFGAGYIYKNLKTGECGSPTEYGCQMGYLDSGAWFHWATNYEWLRLPTKSYSTDISAAWEVVEKLDEKGYWLQLNYPAGGGLKCAARFSLVPGGSKWAMSNTAPHAICLAALKAIGVEV